MPFIIAWYIKIAKTLFQVNIYLIKKIDFINFRRDLYYQKLLTFKAQIIQDLKGSLAVLKHNYREVGSFILN